MRRKQQGESNRTLNKTIYAKFLKRFEVFEAKFERLFLVINMNFLLQHYFLECSLRFINMEKLTGNPIKSKIVIQSDNYMYEGIIFKSLI